MQWFVTAMMAVAVPLIIYMSVRSPVAPQPGPVLAAILFFVGLWFVSFVGFRPPSVTVTAGKVSVWGDYEGWLRQRMPRSDVASVFRGQAAIFKGGWGPCYFLVTRDGTPQITMSGEDFTDEGMTELAKRLEVPIQGDFSVQVH